MVDETKETEDQTTSPEEDTLVLIYPDGSSEDVTLPPGTFADLKKWADAEGEPFDEKYLLKVLKAGMDRIIDSREETSE